ncbi:hypothetical protein ACVME8_006575 [Bradyrhizobium diazoefficiens]
MTTTLEAQGLVEQLDPAALALAAAAPEPARPGSSSSGQALQPEIGPGAVGVCPGHQRLGGHLYIAGRFLAAEYRQSGRTASAPGRIGTETGSGCHRLEGYPVGPAATHGFAAGEQPSIAAKCGAAAAGHNGALVSAPEHHGRTVRREEDIFAAVHAHREGGLAARRNDVGRHVLHSKSECSLWTVRGDAQTDGPAVEVGGACFGWRSAAEHAGCSCGAGKLKIGRTKRLGLCPH